MPNFNEMSLDELENFINSGESNKEQEENTEQQEQEQEQETEESTDDTGTEDQTEESTDESHQEDSKGPGKQFEGKSPEELLKIIQDQQNFISRQGNQIGDFKKQMKQLKETMKPKLDNDKYEKEDVNFIREMIRAEFEEIQEKSQKQLQEEANYNFEQNQQAFLALKSDPVMYSKIKPFLDKQFADTNQDVLYQPGWVQNQIGVAIKQLVTGGASQSSSDSSAQSVIDRKKKANMNSGTSSSKGDAKKKNVANMSSSEYLKHIGGTLGIKDTRGRRGF